MSTHLPGFQSFSFVFLHRFVLAKVATSSIRVKDTIYNSASNILSNYSQFLSNSHKYYRPRRQLLRYLKTSELQDTAESIAISKGVYMTIWTINIRPLTMLYNALMNIISGKDTVSYTNYQLSIIDPSNSKAKQKNPKIFVLKNI